MLVVVYHTSSGAYYHVSVGDFCIGLPILTVVNILSPILLPGGTATTNCSTGSLLLPGDFSSDTAETPVTFH